MYRFALRPRWIVLHVLVLVVVALFALAGAWQLDRLDERRSNNRLVSERNALPEADLDDVLASPGDVEHRRVRASGRYDTGEEVVLLGRGREGRPGHHVLTPLVGDDGRAIVVDRGWVPQSLESPPVTQAAPPPGRVLVRGELLASEGGGGEGRVRRLSRIDVARLAVQLPYPTYSVYLLLGTQDPPQPGELPDPIPPPGPSEGPHLVYAVQWFLFMAIALAGYPALLRLQARRRAGSDDAAT